MRDDVETEDLVQVLQREDEEVIVPVLPDLEREVDHLNEDE